MRRDFIRAIQRKVAISAIPASALRGQQHPGLIQEVRDFLAEVSLKQFGVARSTLFSERLERCTQELLSAVSGPVTYWGVARKALNLFLRDAFYNAYLRNRFELAAAESQYELPLDSVVAAGLSRRADEPLPRWRGVKHLTPQLSQLYQAAGSRQAERMRIARIHLDVYLWTAVRSPS